MYQFMPLNPFFFFFPFSWVCEVACGSCFGDSGYTFMCVCVCVRTYVDSFIHAYTHPQPDPHIYVCVQIIVRQSNCNKENGETEQEFRRFGECMWSEQLK